MDARGWNRTVGTETVGIDTAGIETVGTDTVGNPAADALPTAAAVDAPAEASVAGYGEYGQPSGTHQPTRRLPLRDL